MNKSNWHPLLFQAHLLPRQPRLRTSGQNLYPVPALVALAGCTFSPHNLHLRANSAEEAKVKFLFFLLSRRSFQTLSLPQTLPFAQDLMSHYHRFSSSKPPTSPLRGLIPACRLVPSYSLSSVSQSTQQKSN